MEEFVMSAKFIVGGFLGLVVGYLVGKVMGASKKAKEVRKRMGV